MHKYIFNKVLYNQLWPLQLSWFCTIPMSKCTLHIYICVIWYRFSRLERHWLRNIKRHFFFVISLSINFFHYVLRLKKRQPEICFKDETKLKRYPLGFIHLYHRKGTACLCATLNRAGKRSSCRLAYQSGRGGARGGSLRGQVEQQPQSFPTLGATVDFRSRRTPRRAQSLTAAVNASSSRLWTNISAPARFQHKLWRRRPPRSLSLTLWPILLKIGQKLRTPFWWFNPINHEIYHPLIKALN
jgi:hypothetical protein